jgi:hypothetical protein
MQLGAWLRVSWGPEVGRPLRPLSQASLSSPAEWGGRKKVLRMLRHQAKWVWHWQPLCTLPASSGPPRPISVQRVLTEHTHLQFFPCLCANRVMLQALHPYLQALSEPSCHSSGPPTLSADSVPGLPSLPTDRTQRCLVYNAEEEPVLPERVLRLSGLRTWLSVIPFIFKCPATLY